MSTPQELRPAGTARRPVWFPDTSALVTLAACVPLHKAVVGILSEHDRVLAAAVVDELETLAAVSGHVGKWAATALGQLDWLGRPVRLDDPAGTALALEIQQELSAGRPLKHEAEHYGEAAILAFASRARTVRPVLLSDDYDARIAAHARSMSSLSVHKLLHLMICQSKISSVEAAEFATALSELGRASDYTEVELISGRLGRVGRP